MTEKYSDCLRHTIAVATIEREIAAVDRHWHAVVRIRHVWNGSIGLSPFWWTVQKDRLIVFEVSRADIANVTVASFVIVEHVNVLEQVGPGGLSRSIFDAVHTL